MRFYSPHANLRLMDGPKGTVRFMGGGYETEDEAEIQWLKSHPDFGLRFFVEERAPVARAPEPVPAKPGAEADDEKERLLKENADLQAQLRAMKEELDRLREMVATRESTPRTYRRRR